MVGLMFGSPTVVEQSPVADIPPSPQKTRLRSHLWFEFDQETVCQDISLKQYWFSSLQAFWDWTWDQLADYDLPAVLQFVYNQTGGQKVHYIGHSLVIMHVTLLFSIPSTWVLELGEDAETFALFSRGP